MTNTTQSLSAYEQARIDKIKRNEDRLKSLGLLKAKEDLRASSQKKTPRKRKVKAATVTPPERKSRRLSKQPVQFVPSFDDGDEYEVQQKKRKIVYDAPARRSNFRVHIPVNLTSSPLTVGQQKKILKMIEGDFLGKLEEYLDNVDPVSYQNKRSVMRQITKLSNGEGIHYASEKYGWPEKCVFCKGVKVGPTDDILSLLETGKECEEEWGRDHGNGWLLRHPLKKLYEFQQYHLER